MTTQLARQGLLLMRILVPLTLATVAACQQHERGTNREANLLHAQAEAVLQASEHLGADLEEAARIHARAAALRTITDPRFFDCVSWQAELLAATDQETAARRMYERAGEGALAVADVYSAGIAFFRASKTAQNHSTLAETKRLRDKAVLLMRSMLLSEKERKYLQRWARGN